MATGKELIERIGNKVTSDASLSESFGAVYKFTLEGEGGGTWVLNLKDAPGVSEGDGPADCTISLSAEDFVALVEGRESGQQLFFQGRLRIDGDMGLALKLEKLADLAK